MNGRPEIQLAATASATRSLAPLSFVFQWFRHGHGPGVSIPDFVVAEWRDGEGPGRGGIAPMIWRFISASTAPLLNL